MKKLLIVGMCLASSLAANAWCGPCGPGWGPPPPPCGPCWGGGAGFWGGFAGASVGVAVGGLLSGAFAPRQTVVYQQAPQVVTQPVVVQQPVVVTQPTYVRPAYTSETIIGTPGAVTTTTIVRLPTRVWISGQYVDKVNANGSVTRVWQEGHYEYR